MLLLLIHLSTWLPNQLYRYVQILVTSPFYSTFFSHTLYFLLPSSHSHTLTPSHTHPLHLLTPFPLLQTLPPPSLSSEAICRKCKAASPKFTNPFLSPEVKEDSPHDLALQALAMETSKRSSSKTLVIHPFSFLLFTPFTPVPTHTLPLLPSPPPLTHTLHPFTLSSSPFSPFSPSHPPSLSLPQ